jgi:flagellar biosynthesis protein FliR
MHNRVLVGIISGAVLGVICILGANLRSSEPLGTVYLLSFWYNRVLIGLVVGLISKNTLKLRIFHGAVFGTMVSFGFYSATDFQDVVGFIAGIVYGVLIALAIFYFDNLKAKKAKE